MVLYKKIEALRKGLDKQAKNKESIGFVPTMGALHAGHISLIEQSRQQNKVTACSIFVNPTQFNDPSDYTKYPITIDTDIHQLEQAGCDILFLPSVNEIYPSGLTEGNFFDLGRLDSLFEGKHRPRHFQAVCKVMERLLSIVQPNNLYMGQKDFQQCMVVAKLLKTNQSKSLLHVCPTLREADGLAMSSRNMRLSAEERAKANKIFQCLNFIKNNFVPGSLSNLKKEGAAFLEADNFKVDYVDIADTFTLEPIEQWDGIQKTVAMVAAFNGEVRLIDNLLL